MESQKQNDESRPGATLLGVVGRQGTAVGGGSPQVSKSVSTDKAQRTTETGNIGDNGTRIGHNENDQMVGFNIKPKTASNQNPEGGSKRIINIGVLNETELLNMIKGYVNSMTVFAKKTRNVHKDLKDTLINTEIVLNQYVKIKCSTSKGKDTKSTRTQTEEVPIGNTQPVNVQRKKVITTDVSTDTPCWWPTLLERETNQVYIHQLQQSKEEHVDFEE